MCDPSCPRSHQIPLRLSHAPKVVSTTLQYASWLGNTTGLLMISENDIYIRGSPQGEEDTRLTDTGESGVFYNGVADWLYQGESTTTAARRRRRGDRQRRPRPSHSSGVESAL